MSLSYVPHVFQLNACTFNFLNFLTNDELVFLFQFVNVGLMCYLTHRALAFSIKGTFLSFLHHTFIRGIEQWNRYLMITIERMMTAGLWRKWVGNCHFLFFVVDGYLRISYFFISGLDDRIIINLKQLRCDALKHDFNCDRCVWPFW